MSKTSPDSRQLPAAGEAIRQRLPRCCPSHRDWVTLRDHLVRQFPTVSDQQVDDEIDRARAAVEMFDLTGFERVPTAELIVRHNLMLLTGQVTDSVRLDPETHVRRQDFA
jgi:hypothetical protein